MRDLVLVVAQDVMIRSTLARWLMSAGYSVELAENDRRAREVFAEHDIALTIIAGSRSGAPTLDLGPAGIPAAGRARPRRSPPATARGARPPRW